MLGAEYCPATSSGPAFPAPAGYFNFLGKVFKGRDEIHEKVAVAAISCLQSGAVIPDLSSYDALVLLTGYFSPNYPTPNIVSIIGGAAFQRASRNPCTSACSSLDKSSAR